MSTSQERDVFWDTSSEQTALKQIRRNMKRKRQYVESSRPMQYARVASVPPPRVGFTSVPRSRGAAVTGEMKYFDCDKASTALVATTTTWPAGTIQDPTTTINLGAAAVATPLCLFAPTVGSGLNQRVGRSVKVMKIKVGGRILIPAQTALSVGFNASNVRLILVQDCQTNASQMTSAQLINDSVSTDSTLYAYQNPNNFGRFRVLKDKRIVIQDPNLAGEVAAGNVVSNGRSVMFKFSVRFAKPVEVHFNATNGGTVADIVDHSFHILCATDEISLGPTIQYYFRVSYKE